MFALECSIFRTNQSYHNKYPDSIEKWMSTFSEWFFSFFNFFLQSMYTKRRLQFDELWGLWVPIEFMRLNYEHRHMNALTRTLYCTPKWYSTVFIYLYKSMTSNELSVFFPLLKTAAAVQLYIAFVLSNMLIVYLKQVYEARTEFNIFYEQLFLQLTHEINGKVVKL